MACLLCVVAPLLSLADDTGLMPLQGADHDRAWKAIYEENLARNQALLREFTSKTFHGVELIIAGPSNNNIESRFGHAFLHFVEENNDFTRDFAVGLVAVVDEPQLNLSKGVIGGYVAGVEVDRFAAFISRYAKVEGRSLSRYPLPASRAQLTRLIDVLSKLGSEPGSLGRYYFLGRNCSSLLSEILFEAGFPLPRPFPQRPRALPSYLNNYWISPFPSLVIPAASVYLDELEKRGWNLSRLNQLDLNDLLHFFSKQDTLSLIRLRESYDLLSSTAVSALGQTLRSRRDKPSLEAIYEYRYIPREMYEICADAACAKAVANFATSIWSNEALEKQVKNNKVSLLALGFPRPPHPHAFHFRRLTQELQRIVRESN